MTVPLTLLVACRYNCQAYSTAKVLGTTGSSTMSPEAAVLRLATKLHGGDAQITVEEIEPCRANSKPGLYRIVAQLPHPKHDEAAA